VRHSSAIAGFVYTVSIEAAHENAQRHRTTLSR
jgi:hypothetical protein